MEKKSPSILFVHENFPAQFGAFASWLAKSGWDVKFATERRVVNVPGIEIVNFKKHRDITKGIHHYVAGLERNVISGQAFARVAVDLKGRGYSPDIVMAHSGRGVGAFAKDVWPETRNVPYFEWYYNWPPRDRSRHDILGDELDGRAKARVRNAAMWLDFSAADAAICPTAFQADQFPYWMRSKISVLPDGIDTDLHCPGERDKALLAQLGIPEDAEIVTYLARGMEPARGFPEMMDAISQLQSCRPKLHAIIVGEDRVAYGQAAPVKSWKAKMIEELKPDLNRIHFTGRVSRDTMIRIFRCSGVHLYLSVPFVLSWSVLEAMSCGCFVIAADNAPVREFMADDENARLVDTSGVSNIVDTVSEALDGATTETGIRANARASIIERCDAVRVAYPRNRDFLLGLL